jgi:hypothetical protein
VNICSEVQFVNASPAHSGISACEPLTGGEIRMIETLQHIGYAKKTE